MANLKQLALRTALRLLNHYSPSSAVQDALRREYVSRIGHDRHPVTLEQMAANKSWIFAANRQIAGRGVRAKPKLELVQRVSGKAAHRIEIHDHPFLDLLDSPNLDQTGVQFHWQALVQLNTAGRIYILVEPTIYDFSANPILAKLMGTDYRVMSRLSRMTLLEPDRVTPISATGRRAAAFYYDDPNDGNGRQAYAAAPASPEEREAWKREPYPFVVRALIPAADGWNGQSVTQAADWAINTLYGLNQMWGNQLKNGLHAGLVFKLKKKDLDDVERFEKAVAIVKAGIGKAGEPLIIPEMLVDVQSSPVNLQDMQYESLAAFGRQEALAVTGASDGVVGISQSYSRAAIDGLERIMALGTVDPLNNLLADAYTEYLLPLYVGQSDRSWYEVTFPSCAAVDEVVEMNLLNQGVSGGIMTANEARERLKLKPLPDGDELGGAKQENPFASMFGGGGGFPPKGPPKQIPAKVDDEQHQNDNAEMSALAVDERLARIEALLTKRYSDDQPRDPDGKFASGGGERDPGAVATAERLGLPTKYSGNQVTKNTAVDGIIPRTDKLTWSEVKEKTLHVGDRSNLKAVDPRALKTVQDFVIPESVEKYMKPEGWALMPVSAIRMGGELIVVDGNHRLTAAILRGDKTFEVNIYRPSSLRYIPDQPRDPHGKYEGAKGSSEGSRPPLNQREYETALELGLPLAYTGKDSLGTVYGGAVVDIPMRQSGYLQRRDIIDTISAFTPTREKVAIAGLIASQDYIRPTQVKRYAEKGGTDVPVVIRCAGETVVYDGHHRVMASVLVGTSEWIEADVYHLTPGDITKGRSDDPDDGDGGDDSGRFTDWSKDTIALVQGDRSRYDEDQPRDPDGKFAETGAGDGKGEDATPVITDPKASASYLDKNAKLAAPLSPDEKTALVNYQIGPYQMMNKMLRAAGNDPDKLAGVIANEYVKSLPPMYAAKISDEKLQEYRDHYHKIYVESGDAARWASMNSQILAAFEEKAPALDKPVTAYRSVATEKDLPNLEVGAVFEDRGIISTTTSPTQAERWTSKQVGKSIRPGDRPVLFEIEVTKGTRAIWAKNATPDTAKEVAVKQELMLRPGTKFRVDYVEVDARGWKIVKLRTVNASRARVRCQIATASPLAALHRETARQEKWRSLDVGRRQAEVRLRRALGPVFRAWREEVITKIEAGEWRSLSRAYRADGDKKWQAKLAAAYAPWARAWSESVIRRVLDDLALDSGDIDLSPAMLSFLGDRGQKYAEAVVATQALRIASALDEAAADGHGVAAMVGAVESVFPDVDDPAMRTIASTEACIASGRAVYEGAEIASEDLEGGERVGLMWLSRRDDNVRETHVDADGQIVPLSGEFTVGSSRMRFPGDDELGADIAEIARCRCEAVVVPLVP